MGTFQWLEIWTWIVKLELRMFHVQAAKTFFFQIEMETSRFIAKGVKAPFINSKLSTVRQSLHMKDGGRRAWTNGPENIVFSYLHGGP
jgi:hypothetical protein